MHVWAFVFVCLFVFIHDVHGLVPDPLQMICLFCVVSMSAYVSLCVSYCVCRCSGLLFQRDETIKKRKKT